MYSFEGDYKRRPQQCLSGASVVTERSKLLEHARQQRQKREELRKRTKSTILIQAYIRSYLIRVKIKSMERKKFDQMLQEFKDQPMSNDVLFLLLRKFLFFQERGDWKRLVFVSQLVLKDHIRIIDLATLQNGSPWPWFLLWLLDLNMKYLASLWHSPKTESLAVPLRLIEVFTSYETVNNAVGPEKATRLIAREFEYLVKKGYFARLRKLLDIKTPPILTVGLPPTPLVGCFFDMVVRPLVLADALTPPVFSLVLQHLCQHMFAPALTEPVQMFLIPALAQLPDFPFPQLIQVLHQFLNDSTVVHSTGLLFALLSLEKQHLVLDGHVKSSLLVAYLQLLASLTTNICKLGYPCAEADEVDEDDMDAMEFENSDVKPDLLKGEAEVLEECSNLLNHPDRVQNMLQLIDETNEPLVLQALCQICHNLLISTKLAVHKYRLLYMLAFKPTFLSHLWAAIQRVSQTSVFGCATPLINIISRGIPLSAEESDRIVPLLAVFCSLFSLLIATLHDSEFYGDDSATGNTHQMMPFSLQQLVPMTRLLKDVCVGLVDLAFPDSRPSMKESIHGIEMRQITSQQTRLWSNLFKVVVGLVRQLHTRDNRRSYCPEGHWISKQVEIIMGDYQPSEVALRRRRRLLGYRPFQGLRAFTREELEDQGPPLTTKEVRTVTLLSQLPFLVPFEERVMVFQTIVFKDKMEHQGDGTHFLHGPSIQLSVRRNYLYEDSFDKLSVENEPEFRLRMRVQMVNRLGLSEAGVDGGGLFREFLTELLKTAFDPNRGFFKLTKDNLLYPNPSVHLLVENFPKHYFFIGRILGKALYENLLVELPMADFFLSKLVSRHSDVDIHHLASLDPIMYRNLLFLKSYEGDVLDLGLDFTVMNDELGETRVDDLKPGGSSIPVTSNNRIEYIHLMADYKVNRQIRAQCNSFRQGLASVIPLDWIHMFNNKEFQVLISGAEIPVNVEDLKEHTNYAGGYTVDHITIKMFWRVVDNFTDLQKRQLLKFVTSCSRPPLLGFKELDPPFCILHAGVVDRLPTASTCMNLLKLPEFADEKQMADKLLYAIQSGAGFELS